MSSLNVTGAAADVALIRENLRQYAADAEGAFAENTRRAQASDMRVWSAWCREQGAPAVPATGAQVAAFIRAKAGERAPATIRRLVSTLATVHRAAGLPSPADTQAAKLALKALHREQGRAQKQAGPLNRNLVNRMLAAADSGPKGLRDAAILAVGYDTLARRSELAALEVGHIAAAPDGSGTALIARSKTDQEGAGMLRYLAGDTLARVRAWQAVAAITDGVLFRAVGKGGRIGGPLTGADIARIFKAMALDAGLSTEDAGRISGHSARVGASQDMSEAGIGLPQIMQSGGWKSAEMVARYCARLDAARSGAAQLARRQGRP